MTYSSEQIAIAMRSHWPSGRTEHFRIAEKYIKLVCEELIQGQYRANSLQEKLQLIPVNFTRLKSQLGTYGGKNQQKYWFYWLHQHYPLMTVVHKGSKINRKGELNVVKITREMQSYLDGYVSEQSQREVVESYYKDYIDSAMDWVDIDLDSLRAYIRHAEDSQLLRAERGSRYLSRLTRHIREAKLILSIAEFTKGELPMVIKQSEFGRKYYIGPNLQNVSRIVRHSALGRCYSYDIEASVFVWKFDTAKKINDQLKLPATLEYLDQKAYHRARLALLLFDNKEEYSVKLIKQAITAVGFGARATNTYWRNQSGSWETSSIRQIIHSDELVKRLFHDPWFNEFVREQDMINRILFDHVKNSDSIRLNKLLHTAKGQLSRNKTISYLYQQSEAVIIQALIERIRQQGQDILLLTHDGFYTKNPVDIVDLRYELQQHLPHANLTEDRITAFRYSPEEEEFILAHRRHIQEEEYAVAKRLGRAVHRPKPLRIPHNQRNEDYDAGYDDGTRAYLEPLYEYSEDLDCEYEQKKLPEDIELLRARSIYPDIRDNTGV